MLSRIFQLATVSAISSVCAIGISAQSYNWAGGSSAAYGSSSSWSPARSAPATDDILIFDGSQGGAGNANVTISASETIGELHFINGAIVTITPTAASTLTLSNTGAVDSGNEALLVDSGTSLTLAGNTAGAPIVLALTSTAFGKVAGNVWLNNGISSTGGYDLLASQQTDGLVFVSGSNCYSGSTVFPTSTNGGGGPFGSASGGVNAPPINSVNGGVRFKDGANYWQCFTPDGTHKSTSHLNPFQLSAPSSMVTFETNSNFIVGNSNGFATSGRSYGNLIFRANTNISSSAPPTSLNNLEVRNNYLASQNNVTIQGTADWVINGNLVVDSNAGIFGDNPTNTSTRRSIQVKGNVQIGSASRFNQPTGTSTSNGVILNGSSAQTVDFGGATVNVIEINNSSGVALTGNVLISVGSSSSLTPASLTLTNGELTTNGNTLTLSSAATVSRTSGLVNGTVTQTIPAATGSYTFPVGTTGVYSPVSVSFTAAPTAGSLAVSATAAVHPNSLNPSASLSRYWNLDATSLGTGFTADIAFHYPASEVNGNEANYLVARNTGGNTWQTFSMVADTTGGPLDHVATATGATGFSEWTLGDSSAVPVQVSGFSID
jgi:hypothetical protein